MALYFSKIVGALKSLAESEPSKNVLITNVYALKSEELFLTSRRLAINLRKHNFLDGDVAVIAVEPGIDFVTLMYALLMLNAQIAIIDPEMGKQNYEAKLKQLQPKWMFVDSRLLFLDDWPIIKYLVRFFRKNIPGLTFKVNANKVSVGKTMPFQGRYVKLNNLLIQEVASQELIWDNKNAGRIIVYTSGTLNVPKGVVHTNISLGTSIEVLANIIAGGKNDTVGTYLPHFMLLGIASGLNVKTMNNHLAAVEKLKWFQKEEITIFFGPPSELLPMIIHCEKNKLLFPESLNHLMIGSAPVHQSFLNRLIKVLPSKTRITCTYGMTEHLLVSIADGRIKANYKGEGDLLGRILPGVEVQIADDFEIFVRSPQLFERYFHEETGSLWHASGDLGRITEDGDLILLGRKKEMIIRRDFNIYPALYEGTVKKIPGINEAALVGVYLEELQDEKVFLAIETDLEDISHIIKLLSNGEYSIDKDALPDHIFKMHIPRKGRQNKIDRQAIMVYIKNHFL